MKMNKTLLALLAAGALTACSDSSDVTTDNGTKWDAEGNGYVTISLNCPMSANRANDQFDDGNKEEYAVKDATLLLFAGDSESAATFAGGYKVSTTFSNFADTPNQITSTSKITRKIAQTTGTKIYAYVILNGVSNGIVTFGNGATTSSTGDAVKIGKTDLSASTTFGAFQDIITAIPVDISKGFVMTNAPLASAKGNDAGTITITSTTDVTNGIYSTAEEAAANPAGTIYVERAVAKVTLADGNTGDKKVKNTELDYQIMGWTLDNTNSKEYVARNTSDVDAGAWKYVSKGFANPAETDYRFIGTKPVENGVSLYRTYFAKDVNFSKADYTGDYTLTSLASNATVDGALSTVNDYKPQYCLENTFDVDAQNEAYTTRAIVKVHIGTAGSTDDMYMYQNDANTYKALTGMNTDILGVINGLDAVKAVGTASDLTFTETSGDERTASIVSFKIENTTYSASSADNDLTLFNTVKDFIGTISIYRQGCAYYQVLIKHFGDDLTPWNDASYAANDDYPAVSAANIYPTTNRDANYLGRYGVLRNNWYDLSVTGVNTIGSSDVPTDSETTTDDQIESYISVKINILSWAKRAQSAVLGK